ncbi:MAG: MarR family winged helix-turn-helix transcriptional regulator [Methylococcaceae bacterium]
MSAYLIYEHLERIANLMRTDIRKSGIAHGLQPVQLEALHYLSRCNRYSNNPVAVAEFLGLTKGTVSQSLRVLEKSGLISRLADGVDKRRFHLSLSAEGHAVIAKTHPPAVLKKAVEEAPAEFLAETERVLNQVLRRLQAANSLKSFGVCKTCHHHATDERGNRHCQLTGEDLSDEDAVLLCREHQPPAGEPTELELSSPRTSQSEAV